MFNFTTQTVYNYIDSTEGSAKRNMWIPEDNDATPALRIGNTRFDADFIEEIQVKNPSLESIAEVTFDVTPLLDLFSDAANAGIKEISARFVLYVGLSMNAQDAFYANDFVYKGKPLFIEFPVKASDVDDNGAKLVKRIKDVAKKYLLLSMGDEKILTVTTTAGNAADAGNNVEAAPSCVTFKGVNGYQQIKKAVLQWYDPDGFTVDCCTDTGIYVDLVTGVPVAYKIGTTGLAEAASTPAKKLTEEGLEDLADNEVAILPGLEAFCDYNWLIHNLRLPTAANYYPWSPSQRMGEIPVPGQVYTQFIIRMCKERDGIMGEIVGARGKSVTTHVLYVAGSIDDTNSAAYAVDQALDTLAHNKIKTEADTVLATPYASVS